MPDAPRDNPLLQPLRDSFDRKRNKAGLVPRNWLLITLRIIDMLRDRESAILEDEMYTYDYTLKNSRAASIPKLLTKYGLPTNLGLSHEGVTTRGAPGYRLFREIRGGAALFEHSAPQREAWIFETVEIIREEIMKVVGQKQVALPAHVFEHTAKFIPALLEATLNRSNGRVEQALVGAKLELRFGQVPINPGFAPDRQTGRESDYEVGHIRVLVSVSPSQAHFASAQLLADEGREVYLVVSERAFTSAKKRIKDAGYEGLVSVATVSDYVTSNMKERAQDMGLNAREMCLRLVAEYNRRIAFDRDHSLQIAPPA